MAKEPARAGYWERFDLLSFVGGAVQSVVTNWPAISSYLGGGALLSGLAYFQNLPPIYWGAAFFAGLLAVSATRALTKWGQSREALAALYKASAATPNSFNRLEKEFVRRTFKIADLIHPVGEPLVDKTFLECEIHGPGLLCVSGCHFDGGFGGGNVELVRISKNILPTTPNKAILVSCHLGRCRFYNVVLAVTSETCDQMKQSAPQLTVLGE